MRNDESSYESNDIPSDEERAVGERARGSTFEREIQYWRRRMERSLGRFSAAEDAQRASVALGDQPDGLLPRAALVEQVWLSAISGIPDARTVDFSHHSWEDVLAELAKLREIAGQPAARRLRYAREQDSAKRLGDQASYTRVYETFFTGDGRTGIVLMVSGAGYCIRAGQAHLAVARELRWSHIPAWVLQAAY